MWTLLVPHLLFKTAALFLSTIHFFQNSSFIILSYITYLTRGQGGGGGGGGSFSLSCNFYERYIFSLGSFQHLPPFLFCSHRLGFTPTPVIVVASLQLPDGPLWAPAVHQCQVEFNICSMLLCLDVEPSRVPSNLGPDIPSHTQTWQ